ncbi:MAG: 50S ribosomal protein L29 [Candidatus Anammoxibacter sp.]
MITSEIRSKSRDELLEEIEGNNRELLNLRFQWQAGEARNSAQYKKTRKFVARLKTILHEKETGINKHLYTSTSDLKKG